MRDPQPRDRLRFTPVRTSSSAHLGDRRSAGVSSAERRGDARAIVHQQQNTQQDDMHDSSHQQPRVNSQIPVPYMQTNPHGLAVPREAASEPISPVTEVLRERCALLQVQRARRQPCHETATSWLGEPSSFSHHTSVLRLMHAKAGLKPADAPLAVLATWLSRTPERSR